MKVRPHHNRLLVKRVEEDGKTKGGESEEHLIIREDDVLAVLE